MKATVTHVVLSNHSFIHLLIQNPLTDHVRQCVAAIGTQR